MQARAEAAVMRTRAAEAEAEAAGLRGRLAEAALAASRSVPAPAAEDTRLAAVSAALRQVEIERDIILRSTAWRATWPLRAAARLLPAGLRRGLRGAVAAAWAAATGRLGGRLRRRRAAARDRRLIASSGLFDAAWYVQRYPDVAAAGLPPLHHYAACGAAEGRDPGPLFSARDYDASHPDAAASGQPALLHYLAHGGAGAWAAPVAAAPACEPAGAVQEAPEAPEAPAATEPPEAPDAAEAPAPEPPALDRLCAERFVALQALRTYAAPHDVPRVTIVTDSIGVDSLYGGVATACILAALLARRLGGGLRLVTRVAAPDPGRIAAVLALHGIGWDGNLDLVHAPPGEGDDVPVAPGDLFLTTSWWSTWATRRSVPASRIAYLLQEDERGFYPLGDDHLRARETMADPSLLYVVNSELLRAHLQAEGLAPGGIAFEPAFAAAAYYPQADRPDGRRNFFFYARPHNPRNLYWRGLQALGAAIDERILPAGDWNFTFVGNATTDMLLPGGARPRVLHSLPWAEYASLVRRMDLGLSLMDTPHPSYPPLDLAASGAVVVTNRFGIKQSLTRYSPNILCVEPTVEGLVEGLRRGVALASDRPAREANFAAQALQRDWAQALEPVLELLAARFGSHAPVHP
jgi:hypothetical protein